MSDNPLYLELAKLGQPRVAQDDRNIFDSRVEGDHLGSVGFTSSADDRRQFYDLKFRYYTVKVRELLRGRQEIPSADDGISGELGIGSSLAATLDEWFAEEVKAYLLRRLHAPVEVVHKTWYNDLPAFLQWSDAVAELASHHSTEELSRLLSTRFPVCIEEERRFTGASEEFSSRIQAVLSANVPLDAGVLALRTDNLRSALSRIAGNAAARLAEGPSRLEDILNVIVRGIRDEYRLHVCDYLEVTYSDGYPRLRLLVSSWDGVSRDEIRHTENAYAEAGGITGSVLLLDPGSAHRWVGTNLLGEDPRQSLRHRMLFESVYGQTSAFLVLPVFDGLHLAGALRAIDPNVAETVGNDVDGRPGTWPLYVRAELSHLADWIGSLLPLLRNAFPGGAEDSPLAEVGRYRPGWLDWLPIRFFSSALTECVRVANMRSEHRSVGCSIALGTSGACEILANRARPYPAVQKERRYGLIENAADLFGRVVPGAGIFVCEAPEKVDTEMRALVYSMILATGVLSTEVVAQKNVLHNMCFIDVDGARRVISIYESGRWSGDYYLNEKTGRWRLRVRDNLMSRLRFPEEIRPQLLLNLVFRYMIPYSYEGHGGLILLAKSIPRALVAEDGFDVRIPLSDMDATVFSTIVSVDGGTWIDLDGMVRQAGIIYSPGTSDEVRPEGGARHKAAQALSTGCRDGIVFAISANRVITCLSDGRIVLRF
jgi:hypothetical protein